MSARCIGGDLDLDLRVRLAAAPAVFKDLKGFVQNTHMSQFFQPWGSHIVSKTSILCVVLEEVVGLLVKMILKNLIIRPFKMGWHQLKPDISCRAGICGQPFHFFRGQNCQFDKIQGF